MNLRKASNYAIGLDIGTASVGWAVVDDNGGLYHIKGQPAWGSRLFASASTAAETRLKRGQRRRYQRRRERLDTLQEIFAADMDKVDSEFFVRLRQSRLIASDRREEVRDYRWPFFNSPDFNEAQYYHAYPTIYHLRAHLMDSKNKEDLRLVYLALHHIVKYRGNFLHEDEGASLSASNADATLSAHQLADAVVEYMEETLSLSSDNAVSPEEGRIAHALDAPDMKNADKAHEIQLALNPSGKDALAFCKGIGKACVGNLVDYSKLIAGVEASQDTKFRLSEEEKCQAFADEACPDEAQRLFEALRSAYASLVLSGILKGAASISHAMIRSYEAHDEDLATLKSLFKDYLPRNKYLEFFRGELDERGEYDINKLVPGTYTSYIAGEKLANKKGTDHAALIKSITKLCSSYPKMKQDARYKAIESRLAAGEDSDFLLKQKTRANGAIPYQLHLEEALAIIDRQGKYYPFLLNNRDTIAKIIVTRIPYYVGPLNTAPDPAGNYPSNTVDHTRKFAWSVRKSGTEGLPVHPWTYDEVIDTDKTAELFIRRMTGTCTYLLDEPVLPRHSLLYEEFCVLNELNGARWSRRDGRPRRLDHVDKPRVVEELFKRRRSANVSYKAVEAWLEDEHGESDVEVSGGQGETGFESKLATYHDLCRVFNVRRLEDAPLSFDELEEIVLWNTVFEDRAIFKRRLNDTYGSLGDGRLTPQQINKLVAKRYSGWGRLSKKLLTGVRVNSPTAGGTVNVMDVLRDGNPFSHLRQMVLMEVLSDKDLCFSDAIDSLNRQRLDERGTALSIDDLQGSPANRRAVNQTLRILDELIGIAGKPPKRICIEVTRDDDWGKKGSRTTSRYKALKEALTSFKADKAMLTELESCKAKLDSDRLLLYFEQLGKCMYTGEPLDINRLNTYQIDHILPQSYIKDDSISNRVLVKSIANQHKLDTLLLDESIIRKNRGWWRALKDAGLMSDKKYRLLTRTAIDEHQFQGFINRQLVETSQIVKFVRQICEQRYPETEVVSVRANVSHGIRDNLGLVKSRELNNYHHAHDAFIACQVAEFVNRCYPTWQDGFTLSMIRKYVKQMRGTKTTGMVPGKSGFVADSMTQIMHADDLTGEVVWDCQERGAYIRKALQYKECFISVQPEVQTGAFWDETVYSPRDQRNGRGLETPLKSSRKESNAEGTLKPEFYGGVSSVKQSYWFVYTAKDTKGKRKYFFEGVPIYISNQVGTGGLQEYAESLASQKKLSDVRVLRQRVPLRQRFELDGTPYYLYGSTSQSNEIRPALELVVDMRKARLVHDLFNNEDELTKDELLSLYAWLVDSADLLSPKLAGVMQLRDRAKAFEALEHVNQCLQLRLIIGKLNRTLQTVDLSRIGGKSKVGQLRINIGSALQDIVWIDQSVTGIFERRTSFEDLCRGI